jgi:hypothetical protein
VELVREHGVVGRERARFACVASYRVALVALTSSAARTSGAPCDSRRASCASSLDDVHRLSAKRMHALAFDWLCLPARDSSVRAMYSLDRFKMKECAMGAPGLWFWGDSSVELEREVWECADVGRTASVARTSMSSTAQALGVPYASVSSPRTSILGEVPWPSAECARVLAFSCRAKHNLLELDE